MSGVTFNFTNFKSWAEEKSLKNCWALLRFFIFYKKIVRKVSIFNSTDSLESTEIKGFGCIEGKAYTKNAFGSKLEDKIKLTYLLYRMDDIYSNDQNFNPTE